MLVGVLDRRDINPSLEEKMQRMHTVVPGFGMAFSGGFRRLPNLLRLRHAAFACVLWCATIAATAAPASASFYPTNYVRGVTGQNSDHTTGSWDYGGYIHYTASGNNISVNTNGDELDLAQDSGYSDVTIAYEEIIYTLDNSLNITGSGSDKTWSGASAITIPGTGATLDDTPTQQNYNCSNGYIEYVVLTWDDNDPSATHYSASTNDFNQ